MRLIEKNSTGTMQVFEDNNGVKWLKSYNVFVVRKEPGNVTVDEKYWDYSKTTAKHVCNFLRQTSMVTRKYIKDGIINTANLN